MYGADSAEYRRALTKVHEEIDESDGNAAIGREKSILKRKASMHTKVVPIEKGHVRKVVSVKVLGGPHSGHVVHKQFRSATGEDEGRLTMSFGKFLNVFIFCFLFCLFLLTSVCLLFFFFSFFFCFF